MPAVMVRSSGRAFLFQGREAVTSFAVTLDIDTTEILKETDPATFRQAPRYSGRDASLIRYDSKDRDRVLEVIARSADWVEQRKALRRCQR